MKPMTLAATLLAALPLGAAGAGPDTEAVEYYNVTLNHYFITASASEVKVIDSGMAGPGWVRSGRSFPAWCQAFKAPAAAAGVCRFYSYGANSHFYTASTDECGYLKSLEAAQRASARSAGLPFTGWQFEGIAFFVEAPAGGACPAGTSPISRVYNNGFATGEGANHRYLDSDDMRELMADRAWIAEGTTFCARAVAASAGQGFGPPVTDFSALVAEWSGIGRWKSEAGGQETKFLAPLALVIDADGVVSGSGDGCTFEGEVLAGDRFGSHYKGRISASGCARAAFDGQYRKFDLERFSNGTLVVRLKRGEDPDEAAIDAVLTAPGTVPLPPSIAAIAGKWSGTVAWSATREEGSTQTSLVSANRLLELEITDQGAITGTGSGCAFAGTLSMMQPGTFGGEIVASGCTDAVFDGTYVDVKVRRDDGRLRVSLELESTAGGVKTETEIEGRLAPAGTPATPPPAAAGLAGSYAGDFVARVQVRDATANTNRITATAGALQFSVAPDGSFSGTGFGCTFAGSLTPGSSNEREHAGTVTASGCADPALDGAYRAEAKREGSGWLQLEMERETEAAGVRTKVKIGGRAVRTA